MSNTTIAPPPSGGFDGSFFVKADLAEQRFENPNTGDAWTVTYAGPSHPKTLAAQEAAQRKALHESRIREQQVLNGKKVKVAERSVEEAREDVARVIVDRLIGWSPAFMFEGKVYEFSEDNAMALLTNPKLAELRNAMLEFLTGEDSFTKPSPKG